MKNRSLRNKLLYAVMFASFLSGCAAPIVKKTELVWPDPPEKARIQFVTGLRSRDDLPKEKSFMEKFQDNAFGSNNIAILQQPSGLAVSDDANRLYVADWVRNFVVVFDFEKSKTFVIGGPSSSKPLTTPYSVALDSAENVYVLDQGTKLVRVFDRSGKFLRDITTLGVEPFERVSGLAIDRKNGLLYVADSSHVNSQNHRIFVFTTDGKFVRYIGKRGTGDGEFNTPTFLYADDGNGNLYVCDSLNFRIQVFDATGKFVAKFGTQGDSPGYFAKIKGIAKDTFGNIYVADGAPDVVTIFNSKFQPLLFFGGQSSKPGYLQGPTAIVIDRNNKIYVADSLSARVNVYQLINTTAADSNQEDKQDNAKPTKKEERK